MPQWSLKNLPKRNIKISALMETWQLTFRSSGCSETAARFLAYRDPRRSPKREPDSMTISLNDIVTSSEPKQYKLHLACRNPDGVHPLDEFVSHSDNWRGWNEWRGNRDDWTRPCVLYFMQFYPKTDAWLFGGAFNVVEKRKDGYTLQSDARLEKYIGRLLVSFHRYQGMRGRAFKLESYIDKFTVSKMLPDVYSGETFPGVERINHDFGTLEAIFLAERTDWKRRCRA